MNDTLQSLIRTVLKVGSGYLVTKGIIDESGGEALAGAVVVIIATVWGILHRTPKPTGTPVAK